MFGNWINLPQIVSLCVPPPPRFFFLSSHLSFFSFPCTLFLTYFILSPVTFTLQNDCLPCLLPVSLSQLLLHHNADCCIFIFGVGFIRLSGL